MSPVCRLSQRRGFQTSAALFNSQLRISKPFALGSTPLDSQLRPGISPLYISPSHTAVSVLKRTSLGFGLIGLYVSELILSSPVLSSELGYILAGFSVLPLPLVHYFTKDYVARLFRLYPKEPSDVPQTFESLTKNETLLAEKISFTGRSYYNTLIKVDELKVTKQKHGWINWKTEDDTFYVHDDIGGLAMDRIWCIAEKNAGISNNRFIAAEN